ncbi:hypothetical protein [Roseivirga sp. E12]|uniref:hypothetical protein n=1 Tax=Roseivirga sp. E12 TaxID=2819237 RepID=UPI001ABC00F0|nr:hypothetical protein [Roseivirga sp. E12]MBO3699052.1 hypothetical protein [Roseivirga sp. E12]
MQNKSIAIIICTEPGSLEGMSQLLVKSIRKFGGKLKDAPIYSIQPRNPELLSSKTITVFEECNVQHEYILLNEKYSDYGFANKVMACDYYARHLSEDFLLFLDSDQIVLNDLDDLSNESQMDVCMRVVNLKGIGTDGNDQNASYWRALYELLEVKKRTYTTTGIGRQRIFSYFNAGLIFARRTSELFQQWKTNFEQLMASDLRPKEGLFFVEQSALSATISSMELIVNELPITYNYSPQTHFHLAKSNTQLALDQIHTFHYHRLFKPPERLNLQKDFKTFQGPKLDWLKRELVSCGINSQPFYEEWELELLTQKKLILQQMKNQKRGFS